MAPIYRYERVLDRLGVSASTLCAIHCAAVPFLVSVLPAIGLGFLGGHTFELVMIATSIGIATFSLGSSYRVHRRLNPLMMMASGALLMVSNFVGHESHSPLVEDLHPYIAAFAGLMIAGAHWLNMRLCKHCEICVHDEHTEHHAVGEAAHPARAQHHLPNHSPNEVAEAEIAESE